MSRTPLPDGPGWWYRRRAGRCGVSHVYRHDGQLLVAHGRNGLFLDRFDWIPDPNDPTKALRVPSAEIWVETVKTLDAMKARVFGATDILLDRYQGQTNETLDEFLREHTRANAEILALRGEAAPEGWSNGHPSGKSHLWPSRNEGWCKIVGDLRLVAFMGWRPKLGVQWEVAELAGAHNGSCGWAQSYTGPDGAFEACEAAAARLLQEARP